MPLFYLELRAEQLENVAKLLTDGVKRWEFSVRCTHCNEVRQRRVALQSQLSSLSQEAPKNVYCEPGVLSPIPGSRGEAHVVLRCKQCERVSSAELVEAARKGVRLEQLSQAEEWTRVAALDFRGLEPVALDVGRSGPFAVETSGGARMEVPGFEEGDWCDYNDREDTSVGVYKLQAQFVRG